MTSDVQTVWITAFQYEDLRPESPQFRSYCALDRDSHPEGDVRYYFNEKKELEDNKHKNSGLMII